MLTIRKLAILFIFIIFSFVLYHLLAARNAIKAKYNIEGFIWGGREGFREGAWFSSPTMDGELAETKVDNVPAATTDTANANMALKQYCVKGAYNAAITGKFVNTEMVKYVLYRGCRFLDFEVFSFDGEPYIAMSTDNTYTTINTTNKITLTDILTTIVANSFVAPSPIASDPVFIHLRIKTNQISLYDKIAAVIKNTVASKMYVDETGKAAQVTGDTILRTIRNKIIVVIDKTYIPTYTYDSPKLVDCINMETGYEIMRKWGYSELMKQQYTSPFVYANGLSTDVSMMKMVMPDMGGDWMGLSRNSIYYPMVLNYGAQVVLYPFYQVDQYLGDYERAFANGKAAFVPIGHMVTYLRGTVGGDSSVIAGSPIDLSENTK